MIREDNILSRQNQILKVVFSLILILISSIISLEKFLIIFTFTFLYMIVSPIIYIYWLKTIIKIIPFFISLFVFGIFFQVSFPDQCFLSLRIIHILLISVYLSETSSIDSFIAGRGKQNSEFWFRCKFFLAATVHFIPILTAKFNENRKNNKNIIDIIVLSMENSVNEIHDIEKAVLNNVRMNRKVEKASLWSNIYLSLMLIIPSLIMFINYRSVGI
jgi:hypothetical protein